MESECDIDERTDYYVDHVTRNPIPPDRLVRLNNKCVDIDNIYEYNKNRRDPIDPYTRQPLDVSMRLRLAEYADHVETSYRLLKIRCQNLINRQKKIQEAIDSGDDKGLDELDRQAVARERRIRAAENGEIPLENLSRDEQIVVEQRISDMVRSTLPFNSERRSLSLLPSSQRRMKRSRIGRRSSSFQREMTRNIIQLNKEQNELDEERDELDEERDELKRKQNKIDDKNKELGLTRLQLRTRQSKLEESRLEISRLEMNRIRNRDYSSSDNDSDGY